MTYHDITGMADVVEALEAEIHALSTLDPYDRQIPHLQERLIGALYDMYELQPRGV